MGRPGTRRRPQPRGGPGRRRFGFLPGRARPGCEPVGREPPGRDDRAPGRPPPNRRPSSPASPRGVCPSPEGPPPEGPPPGGPPSACPPPACRDPARRPSAGLPPVTGRPPADRRPPRGPAPPEPGPRNGARRGGIDSSSSPGRSSSADTRPARPGTDSIPPRPGFPRRFCWGGPSAVGTSRRDFGSGAAPDAPPLAGPLGAASPSDRFPQGVRPRRAPRSRSIRSTMSTGSAMTWCRYSPVMGCSKPSSAACRATRGAPLSSGRGVPGNFPR